MDKFVKMTGPLGTVWGRLTPLQKAAFTLVAVLAVVALAVSVSMAGRPDYSVLFSNLSASDASAVVDKLKESKTDYHITAGGTAVEVPTKDVYELRLQLAGAGLPQGGSVGFEIFDKSNFGMTEFTQKINYMRALQGELSRTIGELGPVAEARVHLAIPEQTVYSDNTKESTASVVLKLKPNGTLGPDQVAAVTHLVSAAVEGLKPGNVSVVDTAGNLLSEADSGSLSGNGLRLSASQFQMQKQYESGLAHDLQAMLERILGPGKAVVRVNARLNFDSKETDSEIYEPLKGGKGVLSSDDQQEETYAAGGKPASGAAAGGPGVVIGKSESGGGDYSRTQSTTRYEVTKHVERVTQAPGQVQRLSVAVLMDGQAAPAVSATIRQAVSAAAGLDTTRGDQVTVDSLPFDNSAATRQDQEMAAADKRDMMMNFGKWGAAVVMAGLFMFFLRGFMPQFKPLPIAEPVAIALPAHMADMGEGITVTEASEEDAEAPAGLLDLRSEEPALPARVAAREAQEIAQRSPDDVARLVRAWLAEGA